MATTSSLIAYRPQEYAHSSFLVSLKNQSAKWLINFVTEPYRLAGDIEKNGNTIKAINCYKKAKGYFDKGKDKIGAKDVISAINNLKKKSSKL